MDVKPETFSSSFKEADIAATGLTIVSEREEVVDFTMPFIYDSVGIVIHLTENPMFTFLQPFTLQVGGNCLHRHTSDREPNVHLPPAIYTTGRW